MENILLAILFTYPGAVAEHFYMMLARKRSFYRVPDQIFRIARDFFISAAITIVSMIVLLRREWVDVNAWITVLHKGNVLLWYAVISLTMSILTGCAWYSIRAVVERINNHRLEKQDRPTSTKYFSTWEQLYNDQEFSICDTVAEIWKDGNRIDIGIAKYMPPDLRTDPGIVLVRRKDTAAYLEEHKTFGGAVAYYIDTVTGVEIILHEATVFCRWAEGSSTAAD